MTDKTDPLWPQAKTRPTDCAALTSVLHACAEADLDLARAWWLHHSATLEILSGALLKEAYGAFEPTPSSEDSFLNESYGQLASLWDNWRRGPLAGAKAENVLLEWLSELGGLGGAFDTSTEWPFYASLWISEATRGPLLEMLLNWASGTDVGCDVAVRLLLRCPALTDPEVARIAARPGVKTADAQMHPAAGEETWEALMRRQDRSTLFLVPAVRQSAAYRKMLFDEPEQLVRRYRALGAVVAATDEGHAFWIEACLRAEDYARDLVKREVVQPELLEYVQEILREALTLRAVSAETRMWLALSADSRVRRWGMLDAEMVAAWPSCQQGMPGKDASILSRGL